MNEEATVRIKADASQVAPGVQQATGEIEGLRPLLQQMSAQFAELSATIRESMTSGAAATTEMAAGMRDLEAQTEKESFSLKRMALSVHEGVESFNGFRAAVRGVGEAWLAAFGVEMIAHGVEKLTEASTSYTSEVEHLSKSFGIALVQADGFHAALHKLGIETDTVTGMAGKMVRQMRQHEDAFNRLGIATRDTEGHFRNMQDIFIDGVDKLRDYAEGVDRTAASQILFGRGAGDLTQILRLNREEMEEGRKTAQELGLQTTGEGVAAMHEYKEAVAEASETWEAFKIRIGQELLPTLRDLAQWFRTDGPQAINQTVGDLHDMVTFIQSIPAMWNLVTATLNLSLQGWKTFFDEINLWLDVLKEKMFLFGAVVTLALSGHLDEAADLWNRVLKKIGDDAERESARIVTAANAAKKAWTDAQWAADAANASIGSGWMSGDGKGDPNYRSDFLDGPPPRDPTAGAGNRLDDIKQGHPSKQKAEKDDLVEQLDEQLKAKETAWGMEQEAQGKAEDYSLASIEKYWRDALNADALSTKDRLAIQDRYLAARKQRLDEESAVYIASNRKQMDAAKDDEAERMRLAKEAYDHEVFLYGENSRQAETAADEVVRIQREAAEKQKRIAEDLAQYRAKMAQMEIDAERERAEFLVQMGLMTEGQLLEIDRQLEERRFASAMSHLNEELALEKQGTVRYQQLQELVVEERKAHQNKLTQIDRVAILQRTAIERQAINQLSSSWGQAIGRLVTLQASFASTIKSLYVGLQEAIGNALARIIENWLSQHLSALLISKAASKVAAIGEITASAGKAGAAGVASYAGAPWPIDTFAPEFGAMMAANAMGYAGFISAEGGAWTVPGGPAMLHPDEMVLPAWAAKPLRSMISGAANTNAPFAANSGDTHNYNVEYHDHSGTVSEAQLWARKGVLVRILQDAERGQAFKRRPRI